MNISYAITVCNEHKELDDLLGLLTEFKDNDSEIVIVTDKDNTISEVFNVIRKYNLPYYEHSLNRDFASHKNFLNSKCIGNYIFQLDADELINTYLLTHIRSILESNSSIEAFWVSRINKVEGITDEDIKRWGWRIDENGWINFPDKQCRIYKNKKEIYWVNAVHEQLKGYKKFSHFPEQEEYCIYHNKQIDRQRLQNQFYNSIIK